MGKKHGIPIIIIGYLHLKKNEHRLPALEEEEDTSNYLKKNEHRLPLRGLEEEEGFPTS